MLKHRFEGAEGRQAGGGGSAGSAMSTNQGEALTVYLSAQHFLSEAVMSHQAMDGSGARGATRLNIDTQQCATT